MLTADLADSRFDLGAWYKATYGGVKRDRGDLHRYQNKAIRFLKRNLKSALFVDVGLGKSIICLTLIADLLNEGWTGRALVIAPLMVAKSTWPEEIKEWKQAAGIEYSLIRAEDNDDEIKEVYRHHYDRFYEAERRVGETARVAARIAAKKAAPYRQAAKELARQRQAMQDVPLHIINVEALEWLVSYWERMGREYNMHWPYDTVLIDESSKFKDYSTKRYRALKKCLKRIKRIHTLTASPVAEGYRHIFAQIFLLDQGERFGRYVTHFLSKYFIGFPRNRPRKWKIRPGAEEKISSRIADICMTIKLADVRDEVQVEDWVPISRKIVLSKELMAQYRDFERTMILKLDDLRIEAVNGGTLFNKLLQMTSGAIYDLEKNIVPVHDEKIEALRELIEELQGEPLMVPYWFKSSLARLRKAFPKAVVIGKNNVVRVRDAWNAGEIDLMLIQPGAAAHGLNLQKGPGHDVAWFDLCWSRESYEQTIGRLSRQGQDKVVRSHHLMCAGTADEFVYECLQDKGEGQDRLFRFIRQARARLAQNDNTESSREYSRLSA